MKVRVYIAFFLLFFSFGLYGQNADNQLHVAQKGVLDLRFADLDTFPPISLDGEWEFYWNKLLSPEDFYPQIYVADAYAEVPNYWSKISINGKRVSDTGYATYRLIILTNSPGKVLRLYFPPVNCAMRVWWNGEMIGSSGNPEPKNLGYEPSIKTIVADVETRYRNELIVQVANYSHREGGFFYAPRLGSKNSLFRFLNLSLIINALLFGAALIMVLYNFFIFFMHNKNYAVLSFLIFAFLAGIRVMVVDSNFISAILPSISYTWKFRIEYFTFFFIPPSFMFYLYQVTKRDKVAKYATYFLLGVAIAFALSLFFPPTVFTQTMPYYQPVYLIGMLIALYLIYKHLRLGTSGMNILAITFLIMFVMGINDILLYLRIIKTISLMPFVLFVLLLGQSIVLAKIFSDVFHQNVALKQELEYQNVHLEDLVKKRTKELEVKSRKLERQNKQLEEQRQELELKDYIITSSLKYASDIQSAIMPIFSRVGEYFDYFLFFMPRDIVSGDGFWFSDKDSKYLFIVLFDATGHGVPAAFITIIATYLLNTLIDEKKMREPNKILEALDVKMKKFLEKQGTEGLDAIVVRIEKNDEEPQLKFSGARLDLYYFNSRTKLVTRHRGTKRSLGYSKVTHNKEVFNNIILTFHKHDVFYLLTDGYLEQVDKDKHRFGTQKFIELLQKIGSEPMDKQEQILKETLIDYMGDEKQRDDISVVGIKNSPRG